ncbi:MAG: lysoplasmalogenase [Flavobacteriaceae bacterium]
MNASKKKYFAVIFALAVTAILLEIFELKIPYAFTKAATTMTIIFFASSNRSMSRLSAQMVTALIFCLLGDIALIWNQFFLVGVCFFLVAHLLLIRALKNRFGFKILPLAFLFSLVSLVSIVYILWGGLAGILKVAVPTYAIVISVMVAQAISVALRKRSKMRSQLAIGAILFMVSDTLLGINGFLHPFPFSGVFILSTYWSALVFLANAGREF